jgi:hypothetical protein
MRHIALARRSVNHYLSIDSLEGEGRRHHTSLKRGQRRSAQVRASACRSGPNRVPPGTVVRVSAQWFARDRSIARRLPGEASRRCLGVVACALNLIGDKLHAGRGAADHQDADMPTLAINRRYSLCFQKVRAIYQKIAVGETP